MRKHLTYANVVATLALVIAVAGIPTAVAVTKKAAKNTVNSKSIVDGSVTGRDLAGVRVETALVAGPRQELRCRKGEQLVSAGVDGAGEARFSFGPTADGNGYFRDGLSGTGVSIACLRASPGR